MNAKEYLKSKLNSIYEAPLCDEILAGLVRKKTSFRRNSMAIGKEELEKVLNDNKITFKTVSYYEDAYLLDGGCEKALLGLDIYQEGKIYLQSLSSMIPPLVVEPKPKETILDMAAAPGGKTCEMAALAENQALITAIEKNKIRSERLEYNIKKQNAKIITVLNTDSRKLDDYFKFDKILLDAPCSGSGTLDISDLNLDKYFSEELVTRSAKTQIELLKKACKLVPVGGIIVYSTCSVFTDENENVVRCALSDKKFVVEEIDLNYFKEIPLLPVKIKGVMCVKPTKDYEGFFVAKLRRVK